MFLGESDQILFARVDTARYSRTDLDGLLELRLTWLAQQGNLTQGQANEIQELEDLINRPTKLGYKKFIDRLLLEMEPKQGDVSGGNRTVDALLNLQIDLGLV